MDDLPARCVREHACMVEMTTLREERDALRAESTALREAGQRAARDAEGLAGLVGIEKMELLARAEKAEAERDALRAQLDEAREAWDGEGQLRALVHGACSDCGYRTWGWDDKMDAALTPRAVDHTAPTPPCDTRKRQIRIECSTCHEPWTDGHQCAPTLGERLANLHKTCDGLWAENAALREQLARAREAWADENAAVEAGRPQGDVNRHRERLHRLLAGEGQPTLGERLVRLASKTHNESVSLIVWKSGGSRSGCSLDGATYRSCCGDTPDDAVDALERALAGEEDDHA